MSKVAIFGGSGFLGIHLVKELIKSFETVTTIGLHDFKHENVKHLCASILDERAVDDIIKDSDIVINSTGQITFPFNECLLVNTNGIDNIVSSVSKWNKRLIHISSVAVYGNAEEVNEDSKLNPMTPYATAKAVAEYLVTKELKPLQYTIIRLSNLYGINQKKGIISYIKDSYNGDRKLDFNNDGSLTRDFLHVEDCASIIKDIVKNNFISGVFNLSGPEKYSIKELVSLFEHISKIEFDASYENVPPYVKKTYIDDTKLKQTMPVQYKYTVEQFFKEIVKMNMENK